MKPKCIVILFLLFTSIIAIADQMPNPCVNFNNIALQLALAPSNAQAPLTLQQIQSLLGTGTMNPAASTRTYSWIHRNRALIIKTQDGKIIQKVLSGTTDNSIEERKMLAAYDSLQSAASDWIINNIKVQLGPAQETSEKLQKYTWQCGIGTLTLTIDQDNNPTAAKIEYQSMQGPDAIDTQIGPNHPEWNSSVDYLGSAYREWERVFSNEAI